MNLIILQIFGRNIVLWNLFCVNLRRVCVRCIFHAANCFGLEGLPFLEELFDALRTRFRYVRQSLIVPGLAG